MRLCYIKDSYIAFLKQYDQKVPDNKNEQRPYIGVILEIKGKTYYAPLSSPKPKHLKMKNSLDFRKINHGKYGALNLNNMIPVTPDALIPFYFEDISDKRYRRLLENQYQCLRADRKQIEKDAGRLRSLLLREHTQSVYEQQLKARCCDLRVLEGVCGRY